MRVRPASYSRSYFRLDIEKSGIDFILITNHRRRGLPLVDNPPHHLGSTDRREFCTLLNVHPGLSFRLVDRLSSSISFRESVPDGQPIERSHLAQTSDPNGLAAPPRRTGRPVHTPPSRVITTTNATDGMSRLAQAQDGSRRVKTGNALTIERSRAIGSARAAHAGTAPQAEPRQTDDRPRRARASRPPPTIVTATVPGRSPSSRRQARSLAAQS